MAEVSSLLQITLSPLQIPKTLFRSFPHRHHKGLAEYRTSHQAAKELIQMPQLIRNARSVPSMIIARMTFGTRKSTAPIWIARQLQNNERRVSD